MSHVLLVEDEPVIRGELKRLLMRGGHRVEEAGSLPEADEQLGRARYELVLADLRLPGGHGTELIARAGAPVVIMTSFATVRSAVEAIQMGAVDYIAKPFDHDELLGLVDRVLQRKPAAPPRGQAPVPDSPPSGLVGRSAAMQAVLSRLGKVAPTEATVLIRGESGTGKELAARAIHAQSPRAAAPLITVNCAAIPASLMESELFGHEKGAFTGAVASRTGLIEAAQGGTLFLDEVGELPMAVQAQLLRVLQEGEVRRVGATKVRQVDVRVLSATHRDLPRMVEEGSFRRDLYFRLRVVEVQLPALRDRPEDLETLAEHLLARACARLRVPKGSFTPEALSALRRHRWPGNVRELQNAIESAVVMCEGQPLTPELLGMEEAAPASAAPAAGVESGLSLEDYFRQFVLEHQGHLSETALARRLGISRKALWERRLRLGIPRPRGEDAG
ncbi:sigma-54 dependent transcriptional regulator [Myxococcaceae bacterium GXIMD 01537]